MSSYTMEAPNNTDRAEYDEKALADRIMTDWLESVHSATYALMESALKSNYVLKSNKNQTVIKPCDDDTDDDMPDLEPHNVDNNISIAPTLQLQVETNRRFFDQWYAENAEKIQVWRRNNGFDNSPKTTTDYLVDKGLLDMLIIAYDLGYPICTRAPSAAITEGHLPVIEWLCATCVVDEDIGNLQGLAAACGDLDIFKLLVRELSIVHDPTEACIRAATFGHIEIIQWVMIRGLEVDNDAIKAAAKSHGQHELVAWLIRMGR